MRRRNFLYILSLILAVVTVVFCVYLSYAPVPMFSMRINKLLNAAYSDGNLLVLDKTGERIFIANEDRKVVSVWKTSMLSNVPDVIVDVAIDDKCIYLVGHDTKDGGLYCTKAHVEQYDLRGRHIRTMYCENIPEEKQTIDKSLVSSDTYKGKLYVTKLSPTGLKASVLCFDDKGTSSEVYSVESDFKIQYAYYYPENNKLSVVDSFNRPFAAVGNSPLRPVDIAEFFGDAYTMNLLIPAVAREENIGVLLLDKSWCWPLYEKDGSYHAYAYARELSDNMCICKISDDNAVEVAKVEKMRCSAAIVFFSCLNFAAVVWLLLSVLYGIWIVLSKSNLNQRKSMLYALAALSIATGLILYYSYSIDNILTEQYKAKAYALSHIAIHDIEHIMPDFVEDLRLHGVKGYMIHPMHQGKTEMTINHFNNLCADCGERDRFYIRLMICGKNSIVNCIDTTRDYPCGYNFTVDTLSQGLETLAGDSWSKKVTPRGETAAFFRPLYDENNVLAGIVETGYYTENLHRLALKKSIKLFISLLTILFYLVPMLFYIFRKKGMEGEK